MPCTQQVVGVGGSKMNVHLDSTWPLPKAVQSAAHIGWAVLEAWEDPPLPTCQLLTLLASRLLLGSRCMREKKGQLPFLGQGLLVEVGEKQPSLGLE